MKTIFFFVFFFFIILMAQGQDTQDTAWAGRLVKEATELTNAQKYDEALMKLDTAGRIFLRTKEEINEGYGNVLHLIGRIYLLSNKIDSATIVFKNAAGIRERIFGEFNLDLANSLNNLAICFHLKGQIEESIKIHNRVLTIRRHCLLPDNPFIGISYDLLGQCYEDLGKYDTALFCLNLALKIRLNNYGEKHDVVAATYTSIANCYLDKGDIDSSIIFHKRCLEIRIEKYGPEFSDLAIPYNNLGNCYIEKKEYFEAIEYFKKGLAVINRYDVSEMPNLVNLYNSLGSCYSELGQHNLALENYMSALKLSMNYLEEDNLIFITIYSSIGNHYLDINEPERAIDWFLKAYNVLFMTHAENKSDIATLLNNLGVCYAELGDFKNSIYFHKESLKTRELFLAQNKHDIASSYLNLATSYYQNNNYDSAITCFQTSLDIFKKIYGENHISLSKVYNNLGSCYYDMKQYDKAVDQHNLALNLRLNYYQMKHPEIALSYRNLATCYNKKGEIDLANVYSQKSLLANNYDNKRFENVFSIETLAETLYQLGVRNLKCSDTALTILAYESFRDVNKALNFQYNKSNYLNKEFLYLTISNYEGCIKSSLCLLNQKKQDVAFEDCFLFSESSKSLSLYESLRESDALHFAGIPDNLLQQEYDLRVDIAYYEKRRFTEEIEKKKTLTDSTLLAINSKLFDLNRAYEALKDTFEHQYPDYYRLKYDVQVESVENVQKNLLQPDQALLEYFVGDSSIFIFLVKKDDYRVIEVKKDFPLETWVKQLRHGIYGYHTDPNRNDNLRDSCIADYIESATALYQKLLAPVDSLLPRRVVIVPDGVLGYIPFEALLTAKPEREDRFHTYPYFGREKGSEHSVGYCYSATLLREMTEKQHRRKPAKTLAAFAPYYDGDTTVLAGLDDLFATRSVAPGDLEPLKYSGAEVAAAQKLLGGDVFSDSVATEARFNAVAGDYRILHLSTHGKADDRAGDYSYLVFSPQKDSLENELLYCRDIYNLSLNADLVVLSACETGIGELKRGEGIISLARAFAYAGAKSIVTTLWSVDDAKTKDFMVFFYRNLKKGMAKDEALSRARSDYFSKHKNEHAHPYFWAGFVGIGDMGAIK